MCGREKVKPYEMVGCELQLREKYIYVGCLGHIITWKGYCNKDEFIGFIIFRELGRGIVQPYEMRWIDVM